MRFLSVGVLLTLLVCIPGSGQASHAVTEQKRFPLEEAFIHPISLPKPVLQVLASQVSESGCPDGVNVDETWFTAANVNLNPAEGRGLIVKPGAKGGCFLGANVGPFWVFRCRAGVYELVLKERALQVDELATRTNGFHDLQFSAATGGGKIVRLTFAFRNGKYVLAKQSTVAK
jgi:hypothetical protein